MNNKLYFKALKITGVAIVSIIAFNMGEATADSKAEITFRDKIVTVSTLETSIGALENEQKDLAIEVRELEDQKESALNMSNQKVELEKELQEVEVKLKDKQGTLDKELEEGRKGIEEQLAGKNSELQTLQEKVTSLKGELDLLQGNVDKQRAEPIEKVAGQYVVGTDIPTGRYQVTNVGRGTNFVVYDRNRDLKVNQILGAENDGDYVFYATDGDLVETSGKIKLIPVN